MEEKYCQAEELREEQNLQYSFFINMKNSIKKNEDFKKVYAYKKSYASKNMIMYILKNYEMERNRLGISVSKKVGNSVVRHTLVRRIREIYRKNEKVLFKAYDIVVVMRVGSYETSFFDLNNEFLELCKKQKILKEIGIE